MKRFAINRLREWKEDPNRLPMIIRGARQVGKTWLMQEFGRTAFERCAYINFDRNERMQNLFSGDFDVDRILRGLALESGMEFDPENPNNNLYSQLFSQYGGASIYVVAAEGNPTSTLPETVSPVVYGHTTTYSKDSHNDRRRAADRPR